jgi:hypothetical protein
MYSFKTLTFIPELPKVGDIAPLGALVLSKGAMEVTSLIWGHFIIKGGR